MTARLTPTDIATECEYCFKASDGCRSIQTRTDHKEAWPEPIMACPACRNYLQAAMRGGYWRYTPADAGYTIVTIIKVLATAAS